MTKTSGFTPLFDIVVKEVGYIAALVYGFIWRYEKLNKRRCTAAIQTIADTLGLSYSTIVRALGKLKEKNWIADLTPDRTNRPHEYQTKRKMEIVIAAKSERLSASSEKTSRSVRENDKETKKKPKEESQHNRNMRELTNEFCKLTRVGKPDWASPSTVQKMWRSPLNAMLKMANKDMARTKLALKKTIRGMEKDNLTIANPKALINVYPSVLARGGLTTKERLKKEGYK